MFFVLLVLSKPHQKYRTGSAGLPGCNSREFPVLKQGIIILRIYPSIGYIKFTFIENKIDFLKKLVADWVLASQTGLN